MKIVAVTSCPTGIAHTYMAAEAMEEICGKKCIDIKVEMQGMLGPENILLESEIEEADVIILANATSIINAAKFEKFPDKTISISPKKIMLNPQIVIDALKENGFLK